MFEYVKELDNGVFEVKLGAGIVPVKITRYEIDELNLSASGTASMPSRYKTIDDFIQAVNAAAKVQEYLANK